MLPDVFTVSALVCKGTGVSENEPVGGGLITRTSRVHYDIDGKAGTRDNDYAVRFVFPWLDCVLQETAFSYKVGCKRFSEELALVKDSIDIMDVKMGEMLRQKGLESDFEILRWKSGKFS